MDSYQAYKKPKRWPKLLIVGFVLVIIAATAAWFLNRREVNIAQPAQTKKAEPATVSGIGSNILFGGDIFLGRSMNKWAQASPLKEAYPFSGLSGFHRENYDAWIANLECPSVPGVTPTSQQEEVALIFNCSTKYLPEMAKWFDIVSIANNHSDNQGAGGFAKTRQQLDKNHVQYFGHYDPDELDEVCEVVSLPVQVRLNDDTQDKGAIPIAMCGYHGVFKIPSDQSIAVMQKYSRYMPVIAYPHMGTEYKPSADALRTDVYRRMIDNGADAVLGNHPHWAQNSEAYKGKLIVYSMGNLIFDQQFSPEVTRSAVITLDLESKQSADGGQLAAWLKLGDTCARFADDCLAEAEKQNLQRLPISLTFGMTAVDSSNKLSKPASPEITKAIAERLDWNTTATRLIPTGKKY